MSTINCVLQSNWDPIYLIASKLHWVMRSFSTVNYNNCTCKIGVDPLYKPTIWCLTPLLYIFIHLTKSRTMYSPKCLGWGNIRLNVCVFKLVDYDACDLYLIGISGNCINTKFHQHKENSIHKRPFLSIFGCLIWDLIKIRNVPTVTPVI